VWGRQPQGWNHPFQGGAPTPFAGSAARGSSGRRLAAQPSAALGANHVAGAGESVGINPSPSHLGCLLMVRRDTIRDTRPKSPAFPPCVIALTGHMQGVPGRLGVRNRLVLSCPRWQIGTDTTRADESWRALISR
jgi:hypothetical protein